jgi:hypothetical protein
VLVKITPQNSSFFKSLYSLLMKKMIENEKMSVNHVWFPWLLETAVVALLSYGEGKPLNGQDLE